MKNGLGALDRALDTLRGMGVEDDIPLHDPAYIEGIFDDAKAALDDVRELCRATRILYAEVVAPLDSEPPYPEARDVIDALDRLMTAREGAKA